MLLRRELLSRQVWLEVENSLLGSKIWFFKPMTYKSLSPQDWSIEDCLRPEAARLIYLKWRPLLALERQTCFTWSRQKEADFTWLCIVWLQCFFGIKHSLLLQCTLGQLHLCPIAQLHCGAGSLVFKAWNSLLLFLQKCVLSLSKYLPTFCHAQGRAENTKMNQTWGLSINVVRQVKDILQ